ncbi:MAG: hypothetical protein WDO12_11790 [Pseudomonadota bacterium]
MQRRDHLLASLAAHIVVTQVAERRGAVDPRDARLPQGADLQHAGLELGDGLQRGAQFLLPAMPGQRREQDLAGAVGLFFVVGVAGDALQAFGSGIHVCLPSFPHRSAIGYIHVGLRHETWRVWLHINDGPGV